MTRMFWTVLVLVVVAGCGSVEQRTRHVWHQATATPQQPKRGVDLNSATRDELADLPGLDEADADRIIAHRPYAATDALLRNNVIEEWKYRRIEDRVYVGRT